VATGGPTDPRYLIEASSFLIERGYCGLVWLDGDLLVCDRAGGLVDFVAIGKPVGEAIVALYGCEEDVRALRHNPRHRLELANIRIVAGNSDAPRLNFYLHWLESSARYVVIVVRNTIQAELEAELENQSRRRALAEAQSLENAKALEMANAELSRANRELDEFADIISHDLRSPMRALRYHAEDIEQALSTGDSAAALARLADLKQQARRMSHMLTDLLSYARIGHSDDVREPTDTRAMAEAIIASLPRPRGFTVEITGTWPVLDTVAPALDVVLRNLVDNAIKHHDRADGRVTLDARPVKGALEIGVIDDGPGIDPRFHAAIFQPFRRIDDRAPRAESGSGMGLSLVRKTAESEGAELTLESDPSCRRGTTFRLRWPGTVA
jgi:signal transduction histidine kinase